VTLSLTNHDTGPTICERSVNVFQWYGEEIFFELNREEEEGRLASTGNWQCWKEVANLHLGAEKAREDTAM
jgi:hypothetical protein